MSLYHKIEKAFGICIDENAAVEMYDMNLDEATRKIIEIKTSADDPNSAASIGMK